MGTSASSSVSGNNLGYVLVANIYVQCGGAILAMLSVSHKWRDQRFAPKEAKTQITRRNSMSQLESNRDFGNGSRRSSTRSDQPQATTAVQAQINAHESAAEKREKEQDLEFVRTQDDLEIGLEVPGSPRFRRTNSRMLALRPDTGDSDANTASEGYGTSKYTFSGTSDSESSLSEKAGDFSASRRPSLPPLLDDAESPIQQSTNTSTTPSRDLDFNQRSVRVTMAVAPPSPKST